MDATLSQTHEADFSETVPNKRTLFRPYWLDGFFYFGNSKRVATLTDVKYIDDKTMVVAHREASKLYLVSFDGENYQRISEFTVDTRRLLNRFFHPDLIALNGNKMYMTEYGGRCVEITLNGQKFKLTNKVFAGNYNYHGIHYSDGRIYLGADRDGVMTVLNDSLKVIDTILLPELQGTEQRIKTIGQDGDLFILGIDVQHGPANIPNDGGDSWIKIGSLNGNNINVIDDIMLKNCQIDGHILHKGLHYLTLDDGDAGCGKIMVVRIESDKLEKVSEISVDGFPHGIDIRNGMLSYTSYATSKLKTIKLPEEITQIYAARMEAS